MPTIKPNAETFAKAVRQHWHIENRLHWRLDVTFREDDSRIRLGNAPAILTTCRHICVNLLQQNVEKKLSMKMKRLRASLDDSYRANLLMSSHF